MAHTTGNKKIDFLVDISTDKKYKRFQYSFFSLC